MFPDYSAKVIIALNVCKASAQILLSRFPPSSHGVIDLAICRLRFPIIILKAIPLPLFLPPRNGPSSFAAGARFSVPPHVRTVRTSSTTIGPAGCEAPIAASATPPPGGGQGAIWQEGKKKTERGESDERTIRGRRKETLCAHCPSSFSPFFAAGQQSDYVEKKRQ